ncbi:MAG TPA: ABC transporter substrate-binding protein [Thermoleophilaceae bacterium]|nr:ABC transporter substrate-binding protein [Thermoleophilaceae bacterium]
MSFKAVLALLAAAILALAVGCGDDDDDGGGGGGDGGGGTQELVYNLPTPPSALFYPALVAEELGFFEEEGVSPKLAPAAEEISATAFLSNGDADVSFADVDEIILARSQGGEHTAIFSPQHTNTAGIVVPEESDIQDISGVEGTKVGLESEESTRFLTAMLESEGVDPESVETAVVGTSGALVAKTFEDGEIQAYVGNASDFTALSANNVALRNITPDEAAAIDGNPMAVLPGTLDEKREAIVGVLRAWTKAQHVGQVNREVVEEIARKKVPAEWRNEASGEAALDLAIDLMKPDDPERIGDVREDVWNTAQDFLVSAGVIEEGQKIEITEALDDSLIEEINDWDRAEVEAAAEEYSGGS